MGIFAVLAQHERKLISSWTKAAPQAKKRQGFTLGTPANLTDTARGKGVEVLKAKAAANENGRRGAALVSLYRGQRLNWSAIAEALNKAGSRTPMGKLWF